MWSASPLWSLDVRRTISGPHLSQAGTATWPNYIAQAIYARRHISNYDEIKSSVYVAKNLLRFYWWNKIKRVKDVTSHDNDERPGVQEFKRSILWVLWLQWLYKLWFWWLCFMQWWREIGNDIYTMTLNKGLIFIAKTNTGHCQNAKKCFIFPWVKILKADYDMHWYFYCVY